MTDEPGARGVGAIIVDGDSPGVSYGAGETLMGFRGIPSADIVFDDVIVPEANLVLAAGNFRTVRFELHPHRGDPMGRDRCVPGNGRPARGRSIWP